jgi:2-polyprenyl-3-methyl-5-hydroxy-6-metoxy-1,4-benzoquinol methylase
MKEADIRSRAAFKRYLELVEADARRYCLGPGRVQLVNCPACDSTRHSPEFEKAGFQYVLCAECGTLFANPRPTPEALNALYGDSESTRYWVEQFFRPVAEVRRQKIFRPRADYVAGRLPDAADKMAGDIGAGFGIFLEELRRLWPEGRFVAIEPSTEMAATCAKAGFQVIESAIEDVAGHDGMFGLVTAFELLEHLFEPRLLVRQAFRLLAPGGYFLATTLNGEGFDIQVLWEKSNSVFPPHHLNFLNPRSLARLCTAAGFAVEEVATPGQLDWDILQGAISDGASVADRFWQTLARNGDDACKNEFQAWLTRHGLSSHMRVLARKP